MECTYAELRRDCAALQAVEAGLHAEQGGLCAYTGLCIRLSPNALREVDFHLEHVVPQTHCEYGQDADYANIVACWPKPNCGFEAKYGAVKKGSWPPPDEKYLFVSPLDPGCTERFSFNLRGEIFPTIENDEAAKKTINKLGLDDPELIALRRSAIRGALEPAKQLLGLEQTRKLLAHYEAQSKRVDRGEAVQLGQFSFVIQNVLPRQMKKIEGIKKSKLQPRGGTGQK
jgi:uncharacterized protein (TIGR02646 family)